MTFFRRAATACALGLLVGLPNAAHAQRADSYTWKFGLDAGSMIFTTRSQDSKVIPSAGAHVMIMARRTGLMVGVTEGFGSDERTSGGLILFNDLRRYQAVLVAFPFKLALEPYFGVGGGVLQVVGPRVDPVVQDPSDRQALLTLAQDASSSGFITALAGVQGRWKRLAVFGQYQLHSSPSDDKLLKGAMHSVHVGLRFGLGSAKDGVRAGGY
ncbi:MAG: hypothetical protein V4558_02590 [Gemmatimonadota bacterium]